MRRCALIPAKEVRPPLPRGPYLVVGLARSGQAAARLLAARGERVRAVDSGHPEGAERLSEYGVEVVLDTDGLAQLEGTHTVVKSPGVPREAAVIAAALERGIEVTGELELAWRALPNRFLAVTGTNGKTTTVELLGHIFRGAGEPVAVAGNVGVPLAGLVGEIEPDATVVAEASSFQLEDTSLFSPEGAIFLNLAPDHLDRHGDLPAYRDAKLRVFANQGNDDVAVWNGDDPELAGVDLGGCARRIEFCRGASPDCEVAAAEGTIFWDGEPLIETAELGIPGEHNVENAMAAAAAALAFGIDRDAVRAGLRSFAGVPHRLEPVAEIGGVRFVNDSKATNVASAAVGIGSFDRGVHAILGGSDKGEPFGAAGRAAARARRRRLPARRHRRADGGRAGAARRGRRPAAPRRRPRGRGPHRRRAPPRPARSSCSAPPAPASTPSRTSKRAASASARSSPRSQAERG